MSTTIHSKIMANIIPESHKFYERKLHRLNKKS